MFIFRPISPLVSPPQNTLRFKVNVSTPLQKTLFFSLEPILYERMSSEVGRRKEGSDSVSRSIWMTEHLVSASAKTLNIYYLDYFFVNSQKSQIFYHSIETSVYYLKLNFS